MHFKNFHEIKILLLLGSFIVYFLKYLLRNPCSLDNNFTIIKILFVNTTPRSKLQLWDKQNILGKRHIFDTYNNQQNEQRLI